MKIQTVENKVFNCSADQTILDSALNSKLIFEYSCKTGQCGVCKTTLLDGEIYELKPQLALTDKEKAENIILTCCCAPKKDILINAEDLSLLHGIEIKTFPARINSIKRYSSELLEVSLRLPPAANFKFIEGQYLDVIHQDIRRSYSIASTNNQNEITLIIKKFENGKMSYYWFENAKVNDLIRIEGPKGTFFLRDHSKPLLFLATGTGIAPVMSILKSLDENKNFEQENSITVYWGNRNSQDFFWNPEFRNLKVNFVFVCSKPNSDWNGGVGYVQDVALRQIEINSTIVYACGSNNMINSAKKLFSENGMSENKFYSDAFVQSF